MVSRRRIGERHGVQEEIRRETWCPGGDEERDMVSRRRLGGRHGVQEEIRRETGCPGKDKERNRLSRKKCNSSWTFTLPGVALKRIPIIVVVMEKEGEKFPKGDI